MHVQTFVLGPLETNCYLLTYEQTKEAVIIDPGKDPGYLLKAIQGLKVGQIWLTHTHYDHIAGLQALREVTQAPIYVHEREMDWLLDPSLNRSLFNEDYDLVVGPAADVLLTEGQLLRLGDRTFEVRETPGHTPGHVSFVTEGMVFSGDVLFYDDIGRCDLPGGSLEDLQRSLSQILYALPDETIVYTGHGPQTSIGR
ncbi:MAG: MBL fold metallo-hydrolase, partial [Tumebacillaceae bacterium]